ncbi:unnamed protein product [Ambrosiozyma monospora]|uniref:Unnamed protein product n=1 Tax=Ambrosiozyma monospora TaxID=43982 RepID=A0A9W6SVA5_AMBMO|nr:unnamed protein product [Ambrosiozyma monospora]
MLETNSASGGNEVMENVVDSVWGDDLDKTINTLSLIWDDVQLSKSYWRRKKNQEKPSNSSFTALWMIVLMLMIEGIVVLVNVK